MAGRYNNRDTRNKGTTYTKTRISFNETGKRRLQGQQKEVKILPKNWYGWDTPYHKMESDRTKRKRMQSTN